MTTNPTRPLPTTPATVLDDVELAEAAAVATTTRAVITVLRKTASITHTVMVTAAALTVTGLATDTGWLTGPAGTLALAAFCLLFAVLVVTAILDDAPDPTDTDALTTWWITGTRSTHRHHATTATLTRHRPAPGTRQIR